METSKLTPIVHLQRSVWARCTICAVIVAVAIVGLSGCKGGQVLGPTDEHGDDDLVAVEVAQDLSTDESVARDQNDGQSDQVSQGDEGVAEGTIDLVDEPDKFQETDNELPSVPDDAVDADDGDDGDETVVEPCTALAPTTFWHSEAIFQDSPPKKFVLKPCSLNGIFAVIPRDTKWEFTFTGMGDGDVAYAFSSHYFLQDAAHNDSLKPIDDPLEGIRAPKVASEPAENGKTTLHYTATWGGEQDIVIHSGDPSVPREITIEVKCLENCDRVTTRFPIMMAHGIIGTDRYFGLVDYWNGMIGPMRDLGTEVFLSSTGMIRAIDKSAGFLAQTLDEMLQKTGARKINIIAHSQGGLDSRYLASPNGLDRGQAIDSITTISTPHHGVPLPLLELLTTIADLIIDLPDFTPEEALVFNENIIDSPGTQYYAWAFQSCGRLDFKCQLDSGGKKGIMFFVTGGEIVTPFLGATFQLLSLTNGPNDGMITVESARWGPNNFGPLWADHMDEVGHLFRDRYKEPFDHVQFYVDWVTKSLIPFGH